nr:hypothetical protein [Sorangium cellulosum]
MCFYRAALPAAQLIDRAAEPCAPAGQRVPWRLDKSHAGHLVARDMTHPWLRTWSVSDFGQRIYLVRANHAPDDPSRAHLERVPPLFASSAIDARRSEDLHVLQEIYCELTLTVLSLRHHRIAGHHRLERSTLEALSAGRLRHEFSQFPFWRRQRKSLRPPLRRKARECFRRKHRPHEVDPRALAVPALAK